MIGVLDHVGIAVRRLDEALARYRILGLAPEVIEDLSSEGVRLAFLPTGSVSLELLESTREGGPVARFLEGRGEGLHHVAFRTPDIRAELRRLEAEGFEPLDREPRPGARGRSVAFFHPKSAHGVLIELVHEPSSGAAPEPRTLK